MGNTQRTKLTMLGESVAETFMGVPALADVSALAADVAVLGASCCTPYRSALEYAQANLGAPRAIREALATWAWAHDRYDFDQGGCVYRDMRARVVDLGDLPLDPGDPAANRGKIQETCAGIVARGAIPLALGGDDSVPLPVLRALEPYPDLTVLQIDAHPDWRDEVHGERYGLSSGMRRASELPFVRRIVQVGMRGLSSAGHSEIRDAKAWGVEFFPAFDVHEKGIGPVIDAIEPGADVFVTIDLDGLDPSIMPAVYVPAPGGLLYWQVVRLVDAVVAKARLRAMAILELVPDNDPEGLGALTAGRIACNAIGALLGNRRDQEFSPH